MLQEVEEAAGGRNRHLADGNKWWGLTDVAAAQSKQ
jgi:hypothetical protein